MNKNNAVYISKYSKEFISKTSVTNHSFLNGESFGAAVMNQRTSLFLVTNGVVSQASLMIEVLILHPICLFKNCFYL